PAVDRERRWLFAPQAVPGQNVTGGDVIGEVRETPLVLHKILVPPGVAGEVLSIEAGEFTVESTICRLRLADGSIRELSLLQKWPVRQGRPYREKIAPDEPMVTGQRSIDTFFP